MDLPINVENYKLFQYLTQRIAEGLNLVLIRTAPLTRQSQAPGWHM